MITIRTMKWLIQTIRQNNRAVEFIVQSGIEYCRVCPNIKRCIEQIDKKPDGKWQPRKSVCIAGLKKYFIKGEQ